jgi:cyclase
MARVYGLEGADELTFLDISASTGNRQTTYDVVSSTAEQVFIPLTVGGGIRTLEDIRNVLRCGADKVCLNTACIKNPIIITEASRKFGSSTIVIAIEAIREQNGTYLAYTDNGREYTGKNVIDWAKEVERLGAGEIIITSVDK